MFASVSSSLDRCSTCTGDYSCVSGDGPLDAKIFVIGERPGQEENKRGVPFIGDAGREFNDHYLRLAGISRDDIYITNTVKCGSDRNKKPTSKEVEICANFHLPAELKKVAPELVVLMGATACSLLGDVDLETVHGIPFKGELLGWSGWVVCMWHPAAGLHRTDLMIPLIDDWRRLGKWLDDQQEHGRIVKTDYRLAKCPQDVYDYFNTHYKNSLVGVDSESHDREPFSLQVSSEVNTGIMVRVDDAASIELLMGSLNQFIYLHGDLLVFHNAPADLPLVERLLKEYLGAEFAPFEYRDTIQEAYQFQNLPQKLKALAYRLLGHRRRSWDQVVGPPSKAKLQEWLLDAMVMAESERQVIERFGKSGKPIKPEIIKSPFERTLGGIMTHTSKSETYDPWARITPEMEAKFGRAPRKGVKWVDEDELVVYGCSDASDSLELALLFDKMREEIVKKEWRIEESDCDDVGVPTHA